jgi:DNA-binding FrmR family transcriptional regulator
MRDTSKKRPPDGYGYQREGRLDDLIRRLRRVEGQVRGLQKMIEEGRYCVDILTQIDAVTAALARVQDQVLESHLNHCVAEALEGEDRGARKERVDEVVTLLKKYRRSV